MWKKVGSVQFEFFAKNGPSKTKCHIFKVFQKLLISQIQDWWEVQKYRFQFSFPYTIRQNKNW